MDYFLRLNKAGMDIVVAALAELPYKHSKSVIDEAMRQFVEQESAAAKPAMEPAKAADAGPDIDQLK